MSTSAVQLYFQMWVWADDGKQSLLTPQPVTRFFRVYRNLELNTPNEAQITAFLTDAIAGNIGRGNYVEIYCGKTFTKGVYPPPDQQLWFSGYVEQVTKNVDRSNQYQIIVHSASLALAHMRNLGALIMEYPHYRDMFQALTGTNAPGQPAVPGTKGILSGTGWEHNLQWVQKDKPVIATAVAAAATKGDNQVVLNSTKGITSGMTIHLGSSNGTGGEGVRVYSVVNSTTVNLWTSLQNSYPIGTSVSTKQIIIPGQGDSWRTDWTSVLLNVQTMAQIYGLYWREAPGSLAHNGTIDIGPLGDSSTLQIWGGDALATQLGHKSGTRVNAAEAQAKGYAVIESAQYQQDTSTITNLLWPTGAGDGDTLVTLAGADGVNGPPLDKKGNLKNGWQVWQPVTGERQYYVKANNKATWHGDTFEIVASQQNDGNWAYGVVDRTSVSGDANNPGYGVRENQKRWPKIKDANLLLSAGLGTLASDSRPVDTWVFTVKHPLTSVSGVPNYPQPGQTIDVQYKGVVWSTDSDDDPTSSTYGQQIVNSSAYTYLQYPNTTDPFLLEKVKKVVQFEDEWTGKQYTQTITMGKMARNFHRFLTDVAQQMERGQHEVKHKHRFVHHQLDHVRFSFSHNPDAWEDTNGTVNFQPGAIVVSDVPNDVFFGDNRSVEYTVTLSDPAQVFNFWFAKPNDDTVKSATGSADYGIFRLAMTKANVGGGPGTTFLVAHPDGTGTTVGHIPNKKVYDKNGCLEPGTYRVKISWSRGIYEAHISRQEKNSNVWQHFTAAVWHDTNAKITPQGAIGWHLLGGQNNATMTHVAMHPHTKKSKSTRGGAGGGGRYVEELTPLDGGWQHRSYDDVQNVSRLAHRLHADGTHRHLYGHVHGPFHETTATVQSITPGSTTTLTFAAALHKGALRTGWLIVDSAGHFGAIASISSDRNGMITGVTSNDPGVALMTAGDVIWWDPLDNGGEFAKHLGHKHGGIYNPPASPSDTKGGWAQISRAADAPDDGSKDFILYPDGTTSIGDKPLTQRNGAVVNVITEGISGANFAKSIEHEGSMLFDAGELDSTTQAVALYPLGTGQTNPVITATSDVFVGANKQDLFDGATGSITSPASWAGQTINNLTGESDAILALTAGTFGGNTYTTVRWYDTQILEPDGSQRKVTIKHDVSLEVPLQIGVSQSQSALNMGSLSYVTGFDGAKTLTLDTDAGTLAAIKPNDTFVINQGTSTMESLTVASVNQAAGQVIATANLAFAHQPGEPVHQTTANGGTTPVNSGGTLDGNQQMDATPAAIDAVAVGFYDGTNWYRGFWGDPTWIAPYGSPMPFLGPLNAVSGDWMRVYAKASAFQTSGGKKLFNQAQSHITVVGVELAIYSHSPGTGVTVYFDAHRHGHTAGKAQHAPGSVTSTTIGKSAVKSGHKHPSHHADAHTHSDLTYWCDSSNVVHWESGTLVDHKGTKYTINGGTEDSPNAGVSGLISPQASAAGNYLVFNSTGSQIQLKDPYNGGTVVTIPAYSAAGGSGGQSTGFGVVSDQFDWSKRPGGGTIKYGPPDGLFKVGKIGYTTDTYTGELPVHSHGGHAKKHGKSHRKGSVGRKHVKNHHQHKHHHKDVVFSITAAGVGPTYTSTLTWTAGTLIDNSGNTIATISANSVGISVSASQLLYWNGSTYAASNAGSVNMDADSSVGYYPVGHMSVTPDAAGYLSIYGWHGGLIQVGSNQIRNDAVLETHVKAGEIHGGESGHKDHHAAKSHSRRHDHPHKPSRHHHHEASFECIGSTFYCNYSPGGTTPTFTSQIVVDDGATSYYVNPTTFAVVPGDWVYVETNGVANGGTVTPTHANSTSFTPTDTQIVLCRISTTTDADGHHHTEGHHKGPHKVHVHHLKTGAVHGGESGTPNHIAGGAVVGGTGGHIRSRGITGLTDIALDGKIIQGHLSYPDSTHILAQSAWDGNGVQWTTVDTNWHHQVFWNVASVSQGVLSGGNLSGFDKHGNNYVFEMQLRGADNNVGVKRYSDGAVYSNGWVRVPVFPDQHLNGQLAFGSGQGPYVFGSTDGIAYVMVCRFDVLNDGTVAAEYYWTVSSPTVGSLTNCSVQFRAVHGHLAS